MSTSEFIIENGVFKRYNGPGVKILEIPEGVTTIDKFSIRYSNLEGCKKIVFPATVKRILDYALNYDYGDCSKLEELEFLGDIDSIGNGAFEYVRDEDIGKKGVKKLTFHGKVGDIKSGAFWGSRITELVFPAGVHRIERYAFWSCRKLTRLYAPSLKRIDECAFGSCKNLEVVDIPPSATIGEWAFVDCSKLKKDGVAVLNGVLLAVDGNEKVPDGVVTIDKKALRGSVSIPKSVRTIHEQDYGVRVKLDREILLTDEKLSGKGMLESISSMKLSVEETAALYLFQSDKQFDEIVAKYIEKNVAEHVEAMAQLLRAKGKAKNYMRAVEYVMKHATSIPEETVRQLYDAGCEAKYKKEAALLLPYLDQKSNSGQPEQIDDQDICAPWRTTYNEHLLNKSIKENKGDDKLFEKVKLADTKELAPSYLVKCAVVPYLDQYTGRPKNIRFYKTDYIHANVVELADKAAALLDSSDLQNLVEKEYHQGGSAWLLPYGRYATGTQITSLISSMKKWEKWYAYGPSGRSDIITARGALMLSETREAMMNLDKEGQLGEYASLRGTDADTIRDQCLADVGLDAQGGKAYNLGNQIVVARLQKDLSFLVEVPGAKKPAKSIPKSGADEKKYAAANADFTEMKKNVKKIIKNRGTILFEDFLSGRERKATDWKKAYQQNPLLRMVASLLVWKQKGKTFTLTEDGSVDAAGNPVVINEKNRIALAHPMEMRAEELTAWQKYFSSHGLKQPFSQIWEPVIDKETIAEDRYAGCLIPFSRFKGQEKHGITVVDENFHDVISIYFDGCSADVERIDWRRHDISDEDNFEVTSFGFFEYTRRTNHIVAYLDKITVTERILKDDVSIAQTLPQFTLAQITEFIKLATENKCTNVTAVLLDYQHKNFPDFDPMAEFTLE